MATNGIDNIDQKNLVEVKGYKTANKNLLKKVALVLGTVIITIALMCSLKSCQANKNTEELPEEEPTKQEQIVDRPSTGNTVVVPSGNNGSNNNGSNNNGSNNNNNNSSNNNGSNNNGSNNNDTNNNESNNNGSTPDEWTTEDLPVKDTVTVDEIEEVEENNPDEDLTRAEKAYIQEYVDYYDISWEDAKASYFAFGPLVLSEDVTNYIEEPDVEYGTRYIFDQDDLAAINAFITELGMTKAEAEEYYVTVVAPSLGKTIATEQYILTK